MDVASLMPKHPGPPLRKITMNIFESDALKAEALYGFGWTERLREIIHEHLNRNMKHTVADMIRDHRDD